MGHEALLLINLASPFPIQPPFFRAVKPWFPWKQQMHRISSAWVMEFLCPISCSTLFNNSTDAPEGLHKMSVKHSETILKPSWLQLRCLQFLDVVHVPWLSSWISWNIYTNISGISACICNFESLGVTGKLDSRSNSQSLSIGLFKQKSRRSSTSRPKQASNTPRFTDIDCLKL